MALQAQASPVGAHSNGLPPAKPTLLLKFFGRRFYPTCQGSSCQESSQLDGAARADALCATVLFGTAGMKTAECDKCAEIRIVHAPLFLPLLSLLIPPLLHNTYIICYIVQSIVLCIYICIYIRRLHTDLYMHTCTLYYLTQLHMGLFLFFLAVWLKPNFVAAFGSSCALTQGCTVV